ncbi:MAG: membrane-bound O-acyltransferase family protein [Opitutae bacterium]|nr:membrane-bound O-acyltransferase family protein [Opitutae bacterium]
MLFNSFDFLLFLPLTLCFYYLLRHRSRNTFLLVASYVFYGSWDWRFLGLLLLSTVVDFYCGKAIASARGSARKKFMFLSLCTNLSILGLFKYYGFFVDSFRDFISVLGGNWSDSTTLNIVLPVGISFYTFQTLSYTIDVYRGRLKPCKNQIDFALFVAYFPQLVAGPIERAKRLLPQIEKQRAFDWQIFRKGFSLALVGLFKKVVIGDCISGYYADQVFAANATHDGGFLFFGLCMFALQIYADFSGYSDIARGVSRMFGIELMVNFRQPYFSRSITEFWRRWHISLSSWLKDYLYVPLGGNRQSALKTYRNLMITMLIGGLWHGASWKFVVWGGLHGLYLVCHKHFLSGRELEWELRPSTQSEWLQALPRILATNFLVLLAWLFFRAESFGVAIDFLAIIATAIFTAKGFLAISLSLLFFHCMVLVVDLGAYLSDDHDFMESRPVYRRALVYSIYAVCIWVAWPTGYTPFIYFQF